MTGGLLLSLVVIRKAHYVWTWYIFGFFRRAVAFGSRAASAAGAPPDVTCVGASCRSALPMLFELHAILEVLVFKRRRW